MLSLCKVSFIYLLLTNFLTLSTLLSASQPQPPTLSRQITGEWSDCSGIAGVCINTAAYSCSAPTVSLRCPGPSAIKCCPAPAGIVRTACTAWSSSGLCKRVADCSSSSTTGLCPGPSNIRCCGETSSSDEWERCAGLSGVCIDVNARTCDAPTLTGLCPGPVNIRCCPKSSSVIASACSATNGLCKHSEDCTTSSESGLCPGPSAILCCKKESSGGSGTGNGTDVPVRPGIYLNDNPPARSQWRTRQKPLRAVIVLHTAETSGVAATPDNRAENTANFIRTRSTPGCYHMLGDTDSIIQLASFANGVYHDRTGSNDWAIAISLAVRAADWNSISADTRNQLVVVMAQMAAIAAQYMKGEGLGVPAAVLLTKAQSESSTASGFISHALRDPTRRSDPGRDFPWAQFFTEYQKRV